MKKTLTLLFFVFGIFTAFGQITIGNDVFPKVGDTLFNSIDVVPQSVMITAPGPGQSWKFDQLSAQVNLSAEVKSAAEGTAFNEFPSADHFLSLESGPERYYRVYNDRIEEIGYRGIDPIFSSVDLLAFYTQPYIIKRAPMNYEDYHQSLSTLVIPYAYDELPDSITSQFPLPISPDSVRLRIAISREDEVDAWGDLEIPSGTFNVLREKRTEIRSSAVEAKIIGLGGWFDITQTLLSLLPDPSVLEEDTVVTYNFFSDEAKEPIAVVTVDEDGNPARVDYKGNSRTVSTRFQQPLGNLDIHVSPNPTLGRCTFEFENLPAGEYTLQVINIVGVKIWERKFDAYGSISLSEDLSGLRKGTYLYSLKTDKGATLKTKRLIILNP